MIKKPIHLITCGLVFILALAGATFQILNRYMYRETEGDVLTIAALHLMDVANEEVHHFNVVKTIRFTQLDDMKRDARAMKAPEDVKETLRRAAVALNPVSCVLVSRSGRFVPVMGEKMMSYDNPEELLKRLRMGMDYVSGGFSETRQVIVYASPFVAPMDDGEWSVGLLSMRPMESFSELVKLDSEDSPIQFSVLRDDGSYLTDSKRDTIYTVLENHAEFVDGDADGKVKELREAVRTGGNCLLHMDYTEDGDSEPERRSIYGTPLPDSDLYLLAVMPYGGALDQSIEDMGRARNSGMLTAVAVLTLGILLVFALYVWISQQQMSALTKARAAAEDAIGKSDRAIAANEAKSAFLSNMSHEIRTPINAVLGMNEMILRESDDANVLAYAGSIRTAGNTLLGLINDILDFSRIEAGKMEIIPVEYELSSILNDLVNMIQSRADDKGLTLILDFDESTPELLHGDEARIKQVAANILTNAVKYTEKGSVTFHVGYERIPDEPENIYLVVSVRDTGIGIKPEDLQKLFSEFERIEEKRNRNIEGTGLGMNIAKSLLEMMGTSLKVESVYGEGSQFSFKVKQRVVNWNPIGDYEAAYRTALKGRKEYKEKFVAPDATALVVDDTPMNLMVFKSLLSRTRIRIDMANSGDEGLGLAYDKRYDIIFLDHMMPDKDGIETLHEMRGQRNNPNLHTPVICLTANAISGAREKYLAEGFDDYLTKPIDSVKLEEMLMQYLPEEKIQRSAQADATASARAAPDMEIPPELDALKGQSWIDLKVGIKNSGSAQAYLPLLRIFYASLDENAETMERFYAQGDYKNYTIKAHALKSSAKIIGATAFGEEARKLESAGRSGDVAYIRERHDAFLKTYRSFKEPLSKAFAENGGEDKPEADADMMTDALEEIRDAAEEMDCDRLQDIFTEMSEYRIPDAYAELWDALSKASGAYDYAGILELLERNDSSRRSGS